MKLFKFESENGTKYYFWGNDFESAKEKLFDLIGYVPVLFTWQEIDELPEGEEVL